MKYLRFFETTQEQESKIGSIDYNAILLNNETGTITLINAEGSDTYTLRFIYDIKDASQPVTYFYSSSSVAPIASVQPVVKIDGEVVQLDPNYTSYDFAEPGEHTIDFIIKSSTIPYNSFQSCHFTIVIIPNGITEIGYGAFSSYGEAEEISIPSSVTTIGENAFGSSKHITYHGTATYGEYDQYWGAQSMN